MRSDANGLQTIALGERWFRDQFDRHGHQLAHRHGQTTVAIGNQARATNEDAVAVGDLAHDETRANTALGGGIGFGCRLTGVRLAVSRPVQSTAVGNRAQATNTNATSIGNLAFATGTNSSALGNSAVASGTDSTAVGQGAAATRQFGGSRPGHGDHRGQPGQHRWTHAERRGQRDCRD